MLPKALQEAARGPQGFSEAPGLAAVFGKMKKCKPQIQMIFSEALRPAAVFGKIKKFKP